MLTNLIGHGRDLTILQMCVRAVLIFLVTLVLIRISGRRSFGMKSAFDNIIVILLGAILSRPIVGASELVPTVCAALIVTILHRALGMLAMTNTKIESIIKGHRIKVIENGQINPDNLRKALITEQDLLSSVRRSLHTTTTEGIDTAYMESDGELSFVLKK